MVSRYAGPHQTVRKHTKQAAYGSACCRCGRPMLEGQDLDLDHTDDGSGYRGWAHSTCNRSAGGRLGAVRRVANQRRRRMLPTTVAFGIQISEARDKTAIAAAGHLEGGLVGVALLAYVDGPAGGVDEVLRLRVGRTVVAVALDPKSQAATLLEPLALAGITVTQLTATDLVVANGTFVDAVAAHTLRVAPHPALDAAARFVSQRPLGGASVWERRGNPIDVAPIDAATAAVWALTRPSQPFFATRR